MESYVFKVSQEEVEKQLQGSVVEYNEQPDSILELMNELEQVLIENIIRLQNKMVYVTHVDYKEGKIEIYYAPTDEAAQQGAEYGEGELVGTLNLHLVEHFNEMHEPSYTVESFELDVIEDEQYLHKVRLRLLFE